MNQMSLNPASETPIENETVQNFEQAIERLSEIVRLMESGELPLDETVSLYEEGMRLVSFCRKKLETAEKKVKMLTVNEETGELELKDFEV